MIWMNTDKLDNQFDKMTGKIMPKHILHEKNAETEEDPERNGTSI
jgi:hypothetical protein